MTPFERIQERLERMEHKIDRRLAKVAAMIEESTDAPNKVEVKKRELCQQQS